MRALIADDDLVSKKLLAANLGAHGIEVEAYDDGDELWEAYVREPSPLVITDWMMPRLTGVDLCRRIRAERADPYTHVMIVTSLSPGERAIEAYRAGVDDFVSKPIVTELFALQIGAAVRAFVGHASSAARRSLERCQSVLGPQHPSLLDTLSELEDLSREERAFVRCRAFLRRQIEIAKKAYGPADRRVRELSLELEEMVGYSEVESCSA